VSLLLERGDLPIDLTASQRPEITDPILRQAYELTTSQFPAGYVEQTK